VSAPNPPILPSRAELRERTREVLSHGGSRNPDVLLVEAGPALVVVKDFAPRSALVRATLGPLINRREIRALRALESHPEVPGYLGSIDDLAFAVAYRPGRRMSRKLQGSVPDTFIPHLERAIRRMHALGVAHLDLRHRTNVLVDAGGEPVLIDFGSAMVFRPGGLGARLVLPLLARIDLLALSKWSVRVGPLPVAE